MKEYIKPDLEIIKLESPGAILRGSLTNVKIQVNEVTVEEFQDGFASEGGFKDISFD